MIVRTNLFPEGKHRAITMSYDDAPKYDRNLIEIFNTYGFKGTFHLNSKAIGEGKNYTEDEARALYRGHEISVHTMTHPGLFNVPDKEIYDEIVLDKQNLERIAGYTVRGMSYPYGHHNDTICRVAALAGMKYSRTTLSNNDFRLPDDFLRWHPTTHHKGDLAGLYEKFMNDRILGVYNMPTFYIWGHAYEFDPDHNNDLYKMEDFCKKAGGNGDIWYATNIEIYDYAMAASRLEISVERKYIFNPSRLSVWVSVNGTPHEILPGENAL